MKIGRLKDPLVYSQMLGLISYTLTSFTSLLEPFEIILLLLPVPRDLQGPRV